MISLFGLVHDSKEARELAFARMFEGLALRGGEGRQTGTCDTLILGVRGAPDDTGQALVSGADGAVLAAIEGEIYNAAPSDIPGLYEKHGLDFARHLNGVFGIALFDARRRRLVLVRDHLGSHSLFYAGSGDRALFATTIHAILQSGLVGTELSPAAMNSYFASTNIPSPGTMFKGISCVRPGAMAIHERGGWSEYSYWPFHEIEEDHTLPEKKYVEEVRETLLDAIAIRERARGAYGSLVSGGLDTSIITATLAKLRGPTEASLPVFSIAFSEKAYSDADLQQIMYRRYPLEPHARILRPEDFATTLEKAVVHLDKPVNDVAFVGMYHAFQLGREAGCKVVFDGEGADELFFTRHGVGQLAFQPYLRIPFAIRWAVSRIAAPHAPTGTTFLAKGRRFLYKLGLTEAERTLSRLPSFFNHATTILALPGPTSLPDPYAVGKRYLAESALKEPLNRYTYAITRTYLPDGLLFKNERMAAANGITNRTPFIDYRLVELAFRIPVAYKVKKATDTDDGTKQVYKKAIDGLIPDEILHRIKRRGFSQPSGPWYRAELKEFVTEALFGSDSQCAGLLNTRHLRRLWDEHVSGAHNHDYLINSALVFELWLRAFRPMRQQSGSRQAGARRFL